MLKHWLGDREKIAVLMPTLRCNITCAHCLLSCSPESGDTMTKEQIREWVTEFIDLGFKPICLTGGEPFLFPHLVQIASAVCAQRSVPLIIQTNGFWASTPSRAIKFLKQIPYISQLGFSVDYAHMRFIKRETVENGVRAAYETGIDNVSLSISYQTIDEYEEIAAYYRHRFPNITIDEWPITPIGRALDNPELSYEYDNYLLDFLPRSCEAQTCFTPIVDPTGNVHLCYHLIMCLGQDDPFLIGNLSQNSLAEILDKTSDPLFAFILAYGGGSLGYLLDEVAPELISREYQRVCQFCYEVFSRPDIVSSLRQILSLPPFAERIEEMLKFQREKSSLKVMDKKEKIVICGGKNCFGSQKNSHLRYYLLNRLIDSGKWKFATIEYVDCLKACNQGPNIMLANSGKKIHEVDTAKINSLIESL